MKILFVTDNLSRTGAPILLAEIIEWLVVEKGISADVLALKDGPLLGRYRGFSRVHVLKRKGVEGHGSMHRQAFKLWHKIKTFRLIPRLKSRKFDLVYVNSVASCKVVPELKKGFRSPLLLHVHECAGAIFEIIGGRGLSQTIPYVDSYIAVSLAVKKDLIALNVDPQKIQLAYGFSRIAAYGLGKEAGALELSASREFIVGGCGSIDWRKGVDLFLLTLSHIKRLGMESKIRFVWLGGRESIDLDRLRRDACKLGVDSSITFLPAMADPSDFFNSIDVFYLPSREEPLGLVCLESASNSVPIICFEGAGGAPELVEDDAGFVVPYQDVGRAAQRIVELYENPEKLERMGVSAKAKVTSKFTKENSCNAIFDELKKLA